jgi:hypothetical protein
MAAQRRLKFGFLLAGMILELMLAPLLHPSIMGMHSGEVVTSIVLLAALWAVDVRLLTLALFVPALATQIAISFSRTPELVVLSASFHLLFLTYVLYRLVRHVLGVRTATMDTVAGAACGYMILALIWCDLFLLTVHLRPDAFVMPSGWDSALQMRSSLLYFSFTTLSTATYGEIHPVSPRIGALCAAESITGQLYLAVMIARLVGLHVAGRFS